jgi:hypothetical protein
MIPDEESGTGYKCTFCGNIESEDIEVNCDCCGSPWPKWQLSEYVENNVFIVLTVGAIQIIYLIHKIHN